MHTILKVSAASLALTAMCSAVAGEQTVPKPANKTGDQTVKAAEKAAVKPADKAGTKAADKPATNESAAQVAAPDKNAADEEAIRNTSATFTRAYNAGDAKAVAAHFTPDANGTAGWGVRSSGDRRIRPWERRSADSERGRSHGSVEQMASFRWV